MKTHPARKALHFVALLVLLAGATQLATAEVRLPKVFGSHMVLQRELPVTVWGWADPNEKVTVQLGDEKQQTVANEKGEWKAVLPARQAGGPYTLTVTGSNKVELEDVLVGEVWLCSGQSNMEMGIGAVQNGKAEIAAADYPNIRLLKVPKKFTPMPEADMEGSWKVCTPTTLAEGGWNGFSAAGYFFGRELHKQLGVAVGLIDASWGGTRIEPWTPPQGFASVPALAHDYELVQLGDPGTVEHQKKLEQTLQQTERWVKEAREAMVARTVVPPMPTYPADLLPPRDVQHATALYNGMIHPLQRYTIRGAIWYQGESNSGEGKLYTEKMKALVNGWRQVWAEPDLAFYFVQIAPYNYGGNSQRIAEFWEAQALAGDVIPNSGMVVINDIGNVKDIHPANKQEVGRRLALWALAKTYKRDGVEYSGPVFKEMAIEGDKLRLKFDHAQGLASKDGNALSWFEIIDADEGPFVNAEAKVDGQTIVLSAPEVKHPVAMRFAWSMLAEPNLVNAAGLPASAFRAGTVPKRDALVMNIPEAKDYQLVYDLDLNKLGPDVTYQANNCNQLDKAFDRIAYFLELTGGDGNTQYVYASMDAFTDKLEKIGVPTFKSGAHFQQNVANMNVYSNVKGIVSGTGLKGGNIEFWPNNYGPGNSAHVPNASGTVYDFGDETSDPADGYGSMQVHNHDAKQTLFALNHWREGKAADVGIGNQPTGNPDWTFAGNAGSYEAKRLRVLVHCK